MGQWLQADAIAALRTEISDDLYGKVVVGFTPLVGEQDGVNKDFQIPQDRINATTLKLYKNGSILTVTTDYSVIDASQGMIRFVVSPNEADTIATTFNWIFFMDVELDHFLNRAANEFTIASYHTDAGFGETIPILPSDIPDGQKPAILLLAAYRAAQALATRYATRYDSSTGEQDAKASQMAERFDKMAERLRKLALDARNDFYQGQGAQYRPSQKSVGYRLPPWTPPR